DKWAEWCLENGPGEKFPGMPPLQPMVQYDYFNGTDVPSVKKIGDGSVLTTAYLVDGFARVVQSDNVDGKQKIRRGLDPRGRVVWEASFDRTSARGLYKKPDWSDVGLLSMTEFDYDE